MYFFRIRQETLSRPIITGWMDGWMDEWMDEWMDGWMDGWNKVSGPRGPDAPRLYLNRPFVPQIGIMGAL
jgi:hypothetical protein